MSVEYVVHCDGPECERHASSFAVSWVAAGFIACLQHGAQLFFCSWDCAMRFAAAMPPTTTLDDSG